MVRSKRKARMLMHKSLPLTAAACLGMLFHQSWVTKSHGHVSSHLPSSQSQSSSTSSLSFAALQHQQQKRTYTTLADKYFQTHGRIPKPRIIHATLPIHSERGHSDQENDDDTNNNNQKKNILVIGDVHGCYDELMQLHQVAVQANDGSPFLYVILVGDLCTKGPRSVEVIRQVRTTPRWLAVRGNNDDGALAAALGDTARRQQSKYKWVTELDDHDVEWMAELPYTILIPAALWNGNDQDDNTDTDTLIVHAGLLPGVDLDKQTIKDMITIRKVQRNSETYQVPTTTTWNAGASASRYYQWASVWKGPFRVIFGHDAPRGLQWHDHAIGIDTGACYGKQLTGMILPERKLVQVDAKEAYCPI